MDPFNTTTDTILTGKQYIKNKYRKFLSYSSLVNWFVVISTVSSLILFTLGLIFTRESFTFSTVQRSPFTAYLTTLTNNPYYYKILPFRMLSNYFVSSTPLYNWVNIMTTVIFIMFLKMRRLNTLILAVITALSSTIASLLSYWKIKVFPNFSEGLCYALIGYAILEFILNIIFFYYAINRQESTPTVSESITQNKKLYTLNQGLLNPIEQSENKTNTYNAADNEDFYKYLENNDFKMDKIAGVYFKFLLVFIVIHNFYMNASENTYFKQVSLSISLCLFIMYKMISENDGKQLKRFAFKLWLFVLMGGILSFLFALTLKQGN